MLDAAATVVVFLVPLPHLSVFERLSRQPNVTSMSIPSALPPVGSTKGEVEVLARLPKSFDFATAPVVVGDGDQIVALVESSVDVTSSQRLARIELPGGRFAPGPEVAGTAGLFAGSSGQAFLLRWSAGATGPRLLVLATFNPGTLVAVPIPQARRAVPSTSSRTSTLQARAIRRRDRFRS